MKLLRMLITFNYKVKAGTEIGYRSFGKVMPKWVA